MRTYDGVPSEIKHLSYYEKNQYGEIIISGGFIRLEENVNKKSKSRNGVSSIFVSVYYTFFIDNVFSWVNYWVYCEIIIDYLRIFTYCTEILLESIHDLKL